jgi:hypothetical protein
LQVVHLRGGLDGIIYKFGEDFCLFIWDLGDGEPLDELVPIGDVAA